LDTEKFVFYYYANHHCTKLTFFADQWDKLNKHRPT